MGGKEERDSQHDTLAVLAGFPTSQLDLNVVYRVSNKMGFFYTFVL
jgi:hypothetical protein